MNPIAIRLLNQQLIVPLFNNPTEVVHYMGAMQAQEYRLMRWAVAMRTSKPSHNAFKKAFKKSMCYWATTRMQATCIAAPTTKKVHRPIKVCRRCGITTTCRKYHWVYHCLL